jgi:hypothetical protein
MLDLIGTLVFALSGEAAGSRNVLISFILMFLVFETMTDGCAASAHRLRTEPPRL